ncbi:hypothetical protein BMR07_15345 [Methylococcaceae bacterium CS1]|nr:hypothetical protein BMR10_16040 [Methylococcaceae bacterium CS4]TXL02861.1 hypothetical protein BMR07_16760 [Methylococcaceae bacterium CS1]TXL03802.1 hypothetical protein BMR09_14085 [Methylococcaceae bacterium CS3]TXL04007.1 hypothetical protein BMR08_16835 [Methylococcaceae bacterium CS2]TXL03222.1 hypothetical protein BMR07_15835 [Methylococcaceae bacterium CS1]
MKNILLSSFLTAVFLASSVQAALNQFKVYNGKVAISTDGFGSQTGSGIISASVPEGATVKAAYLYIGSHYKGVLVLINLNGAPVTFGKGVSNFRNNFVLMNTSNAGELGISRSDVTNIVKPIIDVGTGGVYNFSVLENFNANKIDGEALVVVYEHPSLPEATVAIFDGFADVNGETFSINFTNRLNPSEMHFFSEMSLGISYSCCNQKSTVMVNGQLLTSNAGDGNDTIGDKHTQQEGKLLTVGSFDDPFSPASPSYEEDHERYNISSFISEGDTSIEINTKNGATDNDNIFLATFYVGKVSYKAIDRLFTLTEEIDRMLALSGNHTPLFPGHDVKSMYMDGYYARYYRESNLYLGVKNNRLHSLDGNTMVISHHGLVIPWLLKASTSTNKHSAVTDLSTSINLGTVHGINLNLINPISSNGHTYYYLDSSGDGSPYGYDPISHEKLDDLLNEGNDTVATQEGSHDGSDDERSVILEGYTLILPTISELSDLSADIEANNPEALGYSPSRWNPSTYWSATEGTIQTYSYWKDNKHSYLHMDYNDIHEHSDDARNWVVFEVLK